MNACPSLQLLRSEVAMTFCFQLRSTQYHYNKGQYKHHHNLIGSYGQSPLITTTIVTTALGKSWCISSILQKEMRQERGHVSLKWMPYAIQQLSSLSIQHRNTQACACSLRCFSAEDISQSIHPSVSQSNKLHKNLDLMQITWRYQSVHSSIDQSVRPSVGQSVQQALQKFGPYTDIW